MTQYEHIKPLLEENKTMLDLGSTRVIANWQPKKLGIDSIQQGIAQLVVNILGLPFCPYRVEVRQPHTMLDIAPTEWHRDGNRLRPDDIYMLLWSNVYPTEVRIDIDQSLLPVRDGDVILIENLKVEHRCPVQAIYKTKYNVTPVFWFTHNDRWFVRYVILNDLLNWTEGTGCLKSNLKSKH